MNAGMKSLWALEEACAQYEGLVKAVVYQLGIKASERDDYIQEGRLAIMKALKNYDPTFKVPKEKFLILCIRRHLWAKLNRKYSEKEKLYTESLQLDDLPEFALTADGEETERAILSEEFHHNLNEAFVETLTKLERAVWLDYLNSATYEEISNKHHISRKSVDNALKRIKHKLQRFLTQLGYTRADVALLKNAS